MQMFIIIIKNLFAFVDIILLELSLLFVGSLCLSLSAFLSVSVCVSVCLSLSVCLSACLPVSVCLSVCFSGKTGCLVSIGVGTIFIE